MTLYTSNSCAICGTVKNYLKKFGKTYTEIDVTDNFEARLELQHKYQAQTVPVLVSDDEEEVMIGFNGAKFMSMVR